MVFKLKKNFILRKYNFDFFNCIVFRRVGYKLKRHLFAFDFKHRFRKRKFKKIFNFYDRHTQNIERLYYDFMEHYFEVKQECVSNLIFKNQKIGNLKKYFEKEQSLPVVYNFLLIHQINKYFSKLNSYMVFPKFLKIYLLPIIFFDVNVFPTSLDSSFKKEVFCFYNRFLTKLKKLNNIRFLLNLNDDVMTLDGSEDLKRNTDFDEVEFIILILEELENIVLDDVKKLHQKFSINFAISWLNFILKHDYLKPCFSCDHKVLISWVLFDKILKNLNFYYIFQRKKFKSSFTNVIFEKPKITRFFINLIRVNYFGFLRRFYRLLFKKILQLGGSFLISKKLYALFQFNECEFFNEFMESYFEELRGYRSYIFNSRPKVRRGFNIGAYKRNLLQRQKIQLFYGNLSKNDLRIFLVRIRQRRLGIKRLLRIYQIFEYKIDILLYRSGFVQSIFEARQLIKLGYVLINGVPIFHTNYSVSSGAVISFKKQIIKQLIGKFFLRVYFRKVFLSLPRYLIVDFSKFLITPVCIHNRELLKLPYEMSLEPTMRFGKI